MKVLGVTDSDSYTKWGASILSQMPASWSRSLVVIRTPALPSERQRESALAGTGFSSQGAPLVDLDDLAALVAAERPDVVLLSVRGPVVRVLVRMIVAAVQHRPLIVSGLPGISIPATLLALYYRSQVDLFILHSKREIAEFRELARTWGISQEFGLATLPFLAEDRRAAHGGDDIVFAAQAKVPKVLEERVQLLGWLVATARAHPERRLILKLRGTTGEAQTHSERYPFDTLLESFEDVPDNLTVSTGPMSEHLDRAGALVTVSSTAAIEAIARDVPVLAVDDFGVSAGLINLVFEGSGLLGSSDRLVAGDFPRPDPEWLAANYFQEPHENTWVSAIEAGVARRQQHIAEATPMPLRAQFRATIGGNIRRIWDRKVALGHYDRTLGGYLALAVGLPLRGAVRRYRKVRARAARAAEARAQQLVGN